jgi:two-component system, OmpR family, sensor kinase
VGICGRDRLIRRRRQSGDVQVVLGMLAASTELVVGGPILIVLMGAGGYVLAGAALRPARLLVTARARDGELALYREPASIRELLERVAARYRPRAAGMRRRIVVRADEHELAVDRLRLEQAVGNLVDNALTHGEGDVSVSATVTAAAAAIHVEDSGTGFPSEFIGHAFERFSRADRARSGSGLGLAIVDMVARAHGGSAGAANTEHGADVCIVIPDARGDQR